MEDIKISVLMSVYCKEKPEYLKISIDSIINQTYKANEFVIICDGPLTYELDTLLEKYKNKSPDFFKIIRLEKNMGLGLSLQRGVLECRNEYIARMDSDDYSKENRLELQIEKIANDPYIDVVGSNIVEFENNFDKPLSARIVPEKNEEIYKYIGRRCPFNHMTVVFKKSSVIAAGNYLDLHFNEDYYLWIRMLLNGCKFYNIQESLVCARIDSKTFSRRGGIKYFRSEKKIQKLLRNNKIIGVIRYVGNVFIRFIVQVVLPNKIRSFLYFKILRKRSDKIEN